MEEQKIADASRICHIAIAEQEWTVIQMAEYISREDVLSKCADIWDNADETTQTGVDIINTIDKITDFIEGLPAADVQPVVHAQDENEIRRLTMCKIKDYCDKEKSRQLYNLVRIIRDSISDESTDNTTVLENIDFANFEQVCDDLLDYLCTED